ncbi:hypothetical protein [Bacillus wiedmannii]|uniref:hypothetical protein n=1 Tax=Bacillus wiedmannii TaxID=1890302 RepID=UPI000BF00004|nr:hypothetical protein [Bacillus wiedmannii]PEM08535.1 hypothetical protein CN610_19990 [Bacillus wiedmannii]
MKKVLSIGLLSLGVMAFATGCQQPRANVMIDGTEYKAEKAEEILEDRLEEENGVDYEVMIVEEHEED